MKLIKIPFSKGGLGKTDGCELAPDKIINNLNNFYLNESGFKPNFQIEEKRFIRKLITTVEGGGSVIIPVFALGRAQEIMLLISQYIGKINCPVYVDGMSRKINKIVQDNPKSIKDPRAFAKAMRDIRSISTSGNRNRALGAQGVFITTSGMLTGGPVLSYLKKLHQSSNNSILLTGYQGEHTNGDMLLKKGYLYIDGWRTRVKAHVEQFDFSAHAGLSELKRLVKDASPDKLIIQHGDRDAIETLAEWARALDFEVYTPKQGDVIKL